MSVFDDYSSEMNGFGGYTDDQVERILQGTATSDEDLALASFLIDLRSLGTEPLDPHLARRLVPMLADAVRLAPSPTIAVRQAGEGDVGTRARRQTMFTTWRRRLATKGVAASIATVLLGGGAAAAATGNLPAPAQEAVARLAAQVGIELPDPGGELPDQAVAGQATAAQNQAAAEERAANAEAFTDAVRQAISEYTTALDAWTACVAENASGRGTTQSDPATRTEEEFDPAEGCDPRPELVIPNPASRRRAGRSPRGRRTSG